jgi:hypothetical protein
MPIEIGLLSTQQDSFEHHEELSKLLNETDVFYVPLRNEFGENNLHTNQDLTKRFDEDLSNKHLIVTFRDIGYSLFLDSVESIPDENDRSKIRVSGKMIVDGICIQFLGCFDYGRKSEKHSEAQNQQINGVGRVELDEEYYRELSSAQISSESDIKSEIKEDDKDQIVSQPIIVHKTRQQTAKLKERTETMTLTNKPKTRSRTISENVLSKPRTTSPPPPPPPPPSSTVQTTAPLPHSILSTTRPRIHSPSHMPYPLRSPRTKQHRPSSPVHSTRTTSEVQSSFISSVPLNFNDYSQMPSTATNLSPSIESSQVHRIQIISQTPHFSSPTTGQPTMPIQIPTPSNTGLPTASLPQLTSLFPLTQSHSLPTYFLPTANIAYITTATTTTNPSGTPFEFSPLTNTSMLLITNPSQHPTQPVHILAPIDHRSLQFAHYAPTSLFSLAPPPTLPPPPPPSHPQPISVPSRTCNILEPMSNFQNKRHDNEEEKQIQQQQPIETNKQSTDQLPFKKRRYTGQQLRMATVHDDDDEVSDESVKK